MVAIAEPATLAHPETGIAEALRTRNVGIVETIISKQFNKVAIGEFDWIRELDSAGYTKREIAQLLMHESTDSPFIYFEPRISDATLDTSDPCDIHFHVTGCIHARGNCVAMHTSRAHLSDDETMIETIQELCGIAGVTPFSRNQDLWNGALSESDDHQTIRLTYALPEGSLLGKGSEAVLARSLAALKRVALAASYLQKAGGCCNSLSVIVHESQRHVIISTAETAAVYLRRLEYQKLLKLLQVLQVLTDLNRQQLHRLFTDHGERCQTTKRPTFLQL
jgi:hypothetical protein